MVSYHGKDYTETSQFYLQAAEQLAKLLQLEGTTPPPPVRSSQHTDEKKADLTKEGVKLAGIKRHSETELTPADPIQKRRKIAPQQDPSGNDGFVDIQINPAKLERVRSFLMEAAKNTQY